MAHFLQCHFVTSFKCCRQLSNNKPIFNFGIRRYGIHCTGIIYLNHTLKGVKFQPFRSVLCCSIFTPDWRIQVLTFTINNQRNLGSYIPVTWIWDMDEMSKPFRYQFLRYKLLVRFYVSNPLGIFK